MQGDLASLDARLESGSLEADEDEGEVRALLREMRETWLHYRATGSEDARQDLIAEYLPLTRFVAGQMSQKLPPSVEYDDLVSYGTIGLMDAIEKFDLDKGVKFGTYAVSRIRGAVLDELRSMDWVPRSVRTKAKSVEAAAAKLGGDLGRMPTDEELANELGVSTDELADLIADSVVAPVVGLDEPVGGADGEEGLTAIDRLIDNGTEDPLSRQVGAEVAETMATVVSRLDRRQRTILALYCVEDLTLSEIGEVMGVTESRVCQMHTRTVSALQDELEARGAGVMPYPA